MVPVARLARCAAASMPRARPETTPKPASPRSRASRSANLTPAAEALRAPTMATQERVEHGALPAHGDQRRGVVDHLQARRIVRLPERDQAHAKRAGGLQLALGVGTRIDAGGRGAAAPRQIRHRLERRARAAVMVDERAEGARADIVAADELQPVEPLLVGQTNAVVAPFVGHIAPRPGQDRRQHRAGGGRRQPQSLRATATGGEIRRRGRAQAGRSFLRCRQAAA